MPQVALSATTTNSITLKMKPHPNDIEPIHGYTVRYKPEFGDWETAQVAATAQKFTLENLWCGSRYQISVTAYNRSVVIIINLQSFIDSVLFLFYSAWFQVRITNVKNYRQNKR